MSCLCYFYDEFMLSRLLSKLNEPMTPLDMIPLRVKYDPTYQDYLRNYGNKRLTNRCVDTKQMMNKK